MVTSLLLVKYVYTFMGRTEGKVFTLFIIINSFLLIIVYVIEKYFNCLSVFSFNVS